MRFEEGKYKLAVSILRDVCGLNAAGTERVLTGMSTTDFEKIMGACEVLQDIYRDNINNK